MKKTSRRWVWLLVAAAAAGLPLAGLGLWGSPTAPATAPAGGTASIVLLHVNDVHGQTDTRMVNGQSVGGYSRLSTLVGRVRSSRDPNTVLFLHAGDEFSRGDDLTRKTLGAANIDILNSLGLDAWTPGNGDFYNGMENLSARIKQARFTTLAANVTDKSTGRCIARPFVVKQVGPVKVGLLGLCTITQGGAGLEANSAIETAAGIVPELRKRADIVVALTHIGYMEDVRLAQDVPGIDVIVGGHSHTVLSEGHRVRGPGGEVLIVQTGSLLDSLGQVELKLKRADGRWQVESAGATLVPLDAQVQEDPAVKALRARLWAATSQPASAKATP